MVFIGDIACPKEKLCLFRKSMDGIALFSGKLLVANLEGNVFSSQPNDAAETLYNDVGVLDCLLSAGKTVVSLANNHMCDYPKQIEHTVYELDKRGISWFGLTEPEGSIKPLEICYNDRKYAFFGHVWRLYTETSSNNITDIRVVDCPYDEFIKAVDQYCNSHRDVAVICYMHWNYDLEILPFPMHRLIARELINKGVSVVIGNHSHVPQGGEMYNDRPIVYGLGNFYIPSGCFFDGCLVYGEQSEKTMAFEIDESEMKFLCHWFMTDNQENAAFKLISSEQFENGSIVNGLSPYRELSDKEYRHFFVKNRTKRLLVPVFTKFNGQSFECKEKIAIMRVKVIKRLKR